MINKYVQLFREAVAKLEEDRFGPNKLKSHVNPFRNTDQFNKTDWKQQKEKFEKYDITDGRFIGTVVGNAAERGIQDRNLISQARIGNWQDLGLQKLGNTMLDTVKEKGCIDSFNKLKEILYPADKNATAMVKMLYRFSDDPDLDDIHV